MLDNNSNQEILLTGSTGVVGSAILQKLLTTTDAKINLIIRADHSEHLKKRLDELLNFAKISNQADRVRAFRGDITEEKLGLSESEWQKIADHCQGIIHCAASVSLDLPLGEARQHSVKATENILQLQSKSQNCKLEYVSTVGVLGTRQEPLLEEMVSLEKSYHNTYEQSKAEAEQLIYQAWDAGKKITIHRPSMVVGDSKTGASIHFQVFHYILRVLAGRQTLGFLPNLQGLHLDTVPSDFVAQMIVQSLLSAESPGKILHLCAGHDQAIDLSDLQKMVLNSFQEVGIPRVKIKPVPLAILQNLVRLQNAFFLPESVKKKITMLGQLVSYAEGRQQFTNTKTIKLAKSWNIEIPKPQIYLQNVVKNYSVGLFNKKYR